MKLLLALLAVAALALPATASARTHHHPATGHHHRAHKTSQGRTLEYWPIFEEWLTPREGREVEADVCGQLEELAAAGTAERC